MKAFLLFYLLSMSLNGAIAQQIDKITQPTFMAHSQKYFESCGVEGSLVIYDMGNSEWLVSDTVNIYVPTLPASTFKIANLLIALAEKVIDDEEEVIHYKGGIDTSRYGYRPGTYRDMTVSEAFEASAVWVFLDLANKIKKDTYTQYLDKIQYGNGIVDDEEIDFWNYGKLLISPVDQCKFIAKLYNYNLPFSKSDIAIVKDVMLTEIGKNYRIHGKTGWTTEKEMNIGWWVGYVETKNNVYIFATRIMQDKNNLSKDFGRCRILITERIFEDLRLLD
ncbi:penicillin-binding transpeptidase domain-containing protein [Anditalea andensis]|uniref:beta-lactamase n=1 Tax=Anditalea andensis TaxID=1048983 RepID=A0A074LDR7_9BACT|nr:penicillin-binding transpeptidase domain-containing protein [Anditalea andensis]KEO71942.1 hypothetical protein EL17_20720 [Anditalea andensis]